MVHHIVSSAVEPARLIRPGCHLLATRIDTRDEIAKAGPPRAGGLRHRVDLVLRAQVELFGNFSEFFSQERSTT
jgi:hypothetical protein